MILESLLLKNRQTDFPSIWRSFPFTTQFYTNCLLPVTLFRTLSSTSPEVPDPALLEKALLYDHL